MWFFLHIFIFRYTKTNSHDNWKPNVQRQAKKYGGAVTGTKLYSLLSITLIDTSAYIVRTHCCHFHIPQGFLFLSRSLFLSLHSQKQSQLQCAIGLLAFHIHLPTQHCSVIMITDVKVHASERKETDTIEYNKQY